MKTLICLLAVVVFGSPAMAETYVTENIVTDTTWDVAGSPYLLYDSIQVTSLATLTIEPGVTVKLDSMASLQAGSDSPIVAVGSEGNEILFTSGADTPAPDDWWGVYVRDSSGSVFTHCIFEYGKYNLYCQICAPTVSSCTMRLGHYANILCDDASPTFTSCSSVQCDDGVRVLGGSPVFSGCTITDNNRGFYISDQDSDPVINYCNIYNNSSTNMYVRGYSARPVVIIDAENNWWGVDTAPEIAATISIAVASVGFVEVDYDPWLHEVPVEEMTWGRLKAMFAD